MTNKVGLTSAELFTLAQTMRDQNKAPDELMSYSEHAGATATYAMIKAFESMATGLWAVEQRQLEEAKARYLATIDGMRRADENLYGRNIIIEGDSGGGKHVDWRVIPAFPDYEINPIGEVRVIETKEPVHQFRHYGVWAYTLNRWVDQLGESWTVTKLGLIESAFYDPKWGTNGGEIYDV